MTKLEKRIKKLEKELDLFCNEIIKPIIKGFIPLLEVIRDAFKPVIEILQHECYRCEDIRLCELQDLDYPILNCKYFIEIDVDELELIDD